MQEEKRGKDNYAENVSFKKKPGPTTYQARNPKATLILATTKTKRNKRRKGNGRGAKRGLRQARTQQPSRAQNRQQNTSSKP